MDSKPQSSPPDTAETKAAFRKPSNDVAGRKYRRRSPDNQSSEDPDSPKNDDRSSPIVNRGEPAKASEHRDQRKHQERKYGRDQLAKADDSYKHVDGCPPKYPHPYSKHDDYSRGERYADEERHNQRRDSSGTNRSDHAKPECDNGRSRDFGRNVEKYSRDRDTQRSKEKESYSDDRRKYKDKHTSPDRHVPNKKQNYSTYEDRDWNRHRGGRDNRDEGRGYRRNSDHKNEGTDYCEEARGNVKESNSSRRDNEKYRSRELHKSGPREINSRREKKWDDHETDGDKWTNARAAAGHNDKNSVGLSESEAKRAKLFGSDHDVGQSGDGEKQSSSPKQVTSAGNVVASNTSGATNDLNAAKVAAMKAAELVNRNLVGGSLMSTEDKKKLLWGNKKSSTTTAVEPSGHRWDTSVFGDRERQEKFNKLMGVKGDGKVETKRSSNPDGGGHLVAEKQEQLQMELEKQYTAGLRRRDGRTVGLGL